MKLPEVTHLTFLVLDFLNSGPQSSEQLIEKLSQFVPDYKDVKFYQLMQRMIAGKMVRGFHKEDDRKSHYKITDRGKKIRTRCIIFYRIRWLKNVKQTAAEKVRLTS